MKLKHEKVTLIKVSYSDLEDLIQEEYNQPKWRLVADLECSNDSTKEMSADKGEVDAQARKDIEAFRETGRGDYMTYILMCDMADRGVIDEGDYLIDICW